MSIVPHAVVKSATTRCQPTLGRAHVERLRDHLRPRCGGLLYRLDEGWLRHISSGDFGALRREEPRRRETDAAGGSGDDRYLAVQT